MHSKKHMKLVNKAKCPSLTVKGQNVLIRELNSAINTIDLNKIPSSKEGYIGGSSIRIVEYLGILNRNDNKRFRNAINNTATKLFKSPEKYGLNKKFWQFTPIEKKPEHALGSADVTETRKRPAWFFGYKNIKTSNLNIADSNEYIDTIVNSALSLATIAQLTQEINNRFPKI